MYPYTIAFSEKSALQKRNIITMTYHNNRGPTHIVTFMHISKTFASIQRQVSFPSRGQRQRELTFNAHRKEAHNPIVDKK
jgi:hypothetical protein